MFIRTIIYLVATCQDQNLAGAPVYRIAFLGLSWIYRFVVSSTRFFYQSGLIPRKNLGRPVISVGNITWGGTGKTPLVEWICRQLIAKNLRPAVLLRGYMIGDKDGEVMSDESRQLQESLPGVPVMAGRDRVASAQKALAQGNVDVFILDDGFQHWKVKRNLDIVVVNAANPFGNGHLIPRGSLRESARSLRHADLVVLTKTDIARSSLPHLRNRLVAIQPQISIIETVHRPLSVVVPGTASPEKGLDYLKGRKVLGFCAIGDPNSFRKTLQNMEAHLEEFLAFRDHHQYTQNDWQDLLSACRRKGINTIVTTEKDAVKIGAFLNSLDGRELLVLKIGIEITYGKEIFCQRIFDLF